MPTTYTDDDHRAARRYYETEGLAAAHRATGIPKTTIATWARQHDWLSASTVEVQQSREKTAVGREVLAVSRAARMEALADRALAAADQLLTEMTSDQVEHTKAYKDGPVTFRGPHEPYAKQSLAIAFAVLVDKHQVLTGGMTANVGVSDKREVESVAGEVLHLIEGGRKAS